MSRNLIATKYIQLFEIYSFIMSFSFDVIIIAHIIYPSENPINNPNIMTKVATTSLNESFAAAFNDKEFITLLVFLKNIAVIGWILSSAAQTCAVIFNNDIPQKEKKFLVPQEILDGIINCTLFWFITSKAYN